MDENLKNLTILIVEDDNKIKSSIARALEGLFKSVRSEERR